MDTLNFDLISERGELACLVCQFDFKDDSNKRIIRQWVGGITPTFHPHLVMALDDLGMTSEMIGFLMDIAKKTMFDMTFRDYKILKKMSEVFPLQVTSGLFGNRDIYIYKDKNKSQLHYEFALVLE